MRKRGLQLALLLVLYAVGVRLHAQSSEEDLAAVHDALTGRWEGQVEGVRPITGEAYTQPDVFTFVVTSRDGRHDEDAAYRVIAEARYKRAPLQ